ncbi:2-dehydropantoate 2-reductase [Desulfacinum hydrothermale DSM 13146]|uniref:2-dehydropantoate 2-reductase n=1 Tax=Desulfacinum hydrothermale DSM 13146 TaxID=1121390 RepID=A0A1W1X0B5_9BACT|nr:2-dehydropantoate 2-reductase [Desulfacinum hydrothermale]SMC17412.1 2-dehydropantoate 2-reductase [Desulfacinum hydrothermale DSM 13146]
MDILVVGAGAIGGYYGGRLAQGGARVSVVARSDYEAVVQDGIAVESPAGDFVFRPHRVFRSASEVGAPVDVVLVGLKVLPQIPVVDLIRPAVGPSTAILLIQNGVGIERPVAEAFPHNEIISALAFICVSRSGPGRVCHQDYGRIVIGRYPQGTSRTAEALADLLQKAGVPCQVSTDVVTDRWQKLVWNAPFNPISVLSGGASTREMLESEEMTRLVRAVMEEVCAVASAAGRALADDVVDRMIADTRKMTPYKTSMLLDYEAGRPMEVEAILGNAVRMARDLAVPVPHMETLYALLGALEQRNPPRASRS